MAYPDIKEPRTEEEIALLSVSWKVLLAVSAPVWITAYVKTGQEGFWSAVGLAALISLGVACIIAGLLPKSVLRRFRELAGLSRHQPRR